MTGVGAGRRPWCLASVPPVALCLSRRRRGVALVVLGNPVRMGAARLLGRSSAGDRSVAVLVAAAAERFSPLLRFAKGRGAAAGDGVVAAATGKGERERGRRHRAGGKCPGSHLPYLRVATLGSADALPPRRSAAETEEISPGAAGG